VLTGWHVTRGDEMGILDDLKERQRTATGAIVETIASAASLPVATIIGLGKAAHGENFDVASTKVMNAWAATGNRIGREQSDEMVRLFIEIPLHKYHAEKR
jgi:hypothetical protein